MSNVQTRRFGYSGYFLDVDLTTCRIEKRPIPQEWKEQYVSGVGWTTRILYDEVSADVDALSPENVLAFGVGVLAGTHVPTACRAEASAKSPLTGLIGTANSGNYWGAELKYAGYDAVVVRGRAQSPVYLLIADGLVELRSAEEYWGKDCWTTIDGLRHDLQEPNLQVALIGPAGENLVRFASIENGYFDAWGRTGLGAVMGSKNLKAIAVRGTGPIHVFDKKAFLQAVDDTRKAITNSPFYTPFRRFGTMLASVPYAEFGALPGRNFQTGTLDGWMESRTRNQVEKYSKRGIACIACPIACAHWTEVPDGPYAGLKVKDMEVSPVMSFGAGCDLPDLAATAKVTEICQSMGMDLCSAGHVVAMAMELVQRGLISETEARGPLGWGDTKAAERILFDIAYRKGLGDVLAEGVMRAGRQLGASQYAMHIKGLEIAMADPRARWSTWTFGFLTNIRGGDHLRCRNPVENLRYNDNPQPYRSEKFGLPDGMYENLDMSREWKERIFSPGDRNVDIPVMSVWAENLISLYNCIGMCIRPPVLHTVGPTLFSRLYSSLTGMELSPEQLMTAGERTWNLQKLFNIKHGEKFQDARYPDRFYDDVLPAGPSQGKKLAREKVGEALGQYYQRRGWDPDTGQPLPETLVRLGL